MAKRQREACTLQNEMWIGETQAYKLGSVPSYLSFCIVLKLKGFAWPSVWYNPWVLLSSTVVGGWIFFSVEDSKNLTCIFPAENSCFFRSQSLHIYMVALCLTYDPVSINDLSQTFSISGQQRKHLNFHGNALLPQSSLLPWQSLNAELMGVRQRTLMACTRSWPSQLKQLSFFLPTSRFLPFLPCRHFDRISLCGSLEWKQLCVISCCI